MVALFLALGGAGFAASVALVKSAKPVVLLPASVSAAGKVNGARMTGGRVSAGVYTLTIRGDSFGLNKASTPVHSSVSPILTISGKGVTTIPPQCGVSSETLAANGSAKVEVDCFAYAPASGWQPADTAFDFQIVGPG
jgi:hypothetical protein